MREHTEQAEGFITFNLINQKSIEGVPTPDIIQIHSVTRDAAGHFYLSDEFNHRIVVLDPGGRCIRTFGRQGNGPGEFWYPRGITIVEFEGDPQLVVCDAWNHRIQRFELDGNFISAFGSIGDGEDQFNEPVAVIPENDGRIWILDRCNHRVKLCSLKGETLTVFGGHRTLEDENRLNDPAETLLSRGDGATPDYGFNYPLAFARDEAGRFLIADTNNNRICIVTENGEPIHFINLKKGKPPYFYPSSVTLLLNGITLNGDINSDFLVMDIDRPWISAPLKLDNETLSLAPAIVVDKTNGNPAAFLFHGKAGIIKRYTFESNPENAPEPSLDSMEIESDEESMNWSKREGADWFKYLLETPETPQKIELMKRFNTTCGAEAVKASKKLTELEAAYCESSREYYELTDHVKKTNIEGRISSEPQAARSWKIIQLRRMETKRHELRRTLVQNISWLISLLGDRATESWRKILSAEKKELLCLLKEAYKERKDDYDKTVSWLRETLTSPDNKINPSQALHACLGLVFLYDHLNYLGRSLTALPGSSAEGEYPVTPLPKSIANRREDMVNISANILFVLGYLSEEWGLCDSAIAIYTYGANEYPSQSKDYLYRLNIVYSLQGDYQACLEVIDEIAKQHPDGSKVNLARGEALKSLFRYQEAMEEFKKGMDIEPIPGLLFSVADLNENSGEFKQALEDYRSIVEESLEQDIFYERAVLGCARVFMYQGNFDTALEFLDSHPSSRMHFQEKFLRARITLVHGKFKETASVLEILLEQTTESQTYLVWYLLAVSQFLSGNCAKSVEYYEKVIAEKNHGSLAQEDFDERMNVRRVSYNRISGEFSEVVKVAREMGDCLIQRPQFLIDIAAAALDSEESDIFEKTMKSFLSFAGEKPYWHSYILASEEQAGLIDKTLCELTERLKAIGKPMLWKKVNTNAWWYTVGHS